MIFSVADPVLAGDGSTIGPSTDIVLHGDNPWPGPRYVIVPPGEQFGGKTYAEWQVGWWQWALGIPWDGHHPVQDRTGADAWRGQAGPVWYLVPGSPSATRQRQVVVPVGQALYIAVGTVECSTIEDPPFHGDDEASLRECTESWHIQELVFEIKDSATTNRLTDLEAYQVTTPMFPIDLPPRNMVGVLDGGSGHSVAAGVGVLVQLYRPGSYTIYLHSNYAEDPAAGLAEMTYKITVVPQPELSIRALSGTGQLEISWPEAASPYWALKQSETLDPDASWTPAAVDSSKVENEARVVAASASPTERFFRLEFR